MLNPSVELHPAEGFFKLQQAIQGSLIGLFCFTEASKKTGFQPLVSLINRAILSPS